MPKKTENSIVPVPLLIALVICVVVTLAAIMEAEKERRAKEEEALVEGAVVATLAVKRAMDCKSSSDTDGDDEGNRKKRAFIKWDHERACQCVKKDYWGSPRPLFDDQMFQ